VRVAVQSSRTFRAKGSDVKVRIITIGFRLGGQSENGCNKSGTLHLFQKVNCLLLFVDVLFSVQKMGLIVLKRSETESFSKTKTKKLNFPFWAFHSWPSAHSR
jgi:hypothetical protein